MSDIKLGDAWAYFAARDDEPMKVYVSFVRGRSIAFGKMAMDRATRGTMNLNSAGTRASSRDVWSSDTAVPWDEATHAEPARRRSLRRKASLAAERIMGRVRKASPEFHEKIIALAAEADADQRDGDKG